MGGGGGGGGVWIIMWGFRFYIVLLLGELCVQQLLPYALMNDTIRANWKGLSDFSIDFMNFSGNKKFLIFGGLLNTIPQNTLFQISLHTNTTTTHPPFPSPTSPIPPPRSSHCSLIHQYKLYIFGGLDQSQKILTDLWEFNTIFKSWSLLSNSGVAVSRCRMVRNQTGIVVVGVVGGRVGIWGLGVGWVEVGYSYGGSVTIQGRMYEGSVKQTLLSIEQMPAINSSSSNLHFIPTITTTNLHLLHIPSPSSSTTTPTTYLLLTDTKITLLNLLTHQITFIKNLKTITNTYHAVISTSWLFLLQLQNGKILMEYYKLEDFGVVGLQEYVHPELGDGGNGDGDGFGFRVVVEDGDLFFVSERSLGVWSLQEHCQWNVNHSHIASCFYNKIQCQQNFIGQMCQIPACPNTLTLFDSTKNQQILYECSNHGTCTATGCQCSPNWGGQDCSTYLRKECSGQLVQNWPILNCQCNEYTTGGNSCTVKFCYNDCSGHGTCLSTGKCSCWTGYYGEDCSITIIQFPGAAVSV